MTDRDLIAELEAANAAEMAVRVELGDVQDHLIAVEGQRDAARRELKALQDSERTEVLRLQAELASARQELEQWRRSGTGDEINRTARGVRLAGPDRAVHAHAGTILHDRRVLGYRTGCDKTLPAYNGEAVLTTQPVSCSDCQGTARRGYRTPAGVA